MLLFWEPLLKGAAGTAKAIIRVGGVVGCGAAGSAARMEAAAVSRASGDRAGWGA
ncbi:MAG: hypothetical protein PHW12_01585 [Smithella sp.]|nr:hypothetical protein [Smithella sp.]MDD5672861.1 hypothetical protein [Chitinivibrionales bacterium]